MTIHEEDLIHLQVVVNEIRSLIESHPTKGQPAITHILIADSLRPTVQKLESWLGLDPTEPDPPPLPVPAGFQPVLGFLSKIKENIVLGYTSALESDYHDVIIGHRL